MRCPTCDANHWGYGKLRRHFREKPHRWKWHKRKRADILAKATKTYVQSLCLRAAKQVTK